MGGIGVYFVASGVLAAIPFPVAGLPRLRFAIGLLGDGMLFLGAVIDVFLLAFGPDGGPGPTRRTIPFVSWAVIAMVGVVFLARAQRRAMRRSLAEL